VPEIEGSKLAVERLHESPAERTKRLVEERERRVQKRLVTELEVRGGIREPTVERSEVERLLSKTEEALERDFQPAAARHFDEQMARAAVPRREL
jgi:hypothetical protein